MPDLTPPPPPRSPWQLLYGAAHALRRRWYRGRAARLPRPVVSVGNLHWGGGGKTPVTAAVAAHLRDRGLSVAVLSRGYKSRGEGVRVVSRGEGPLLGPSTAGDEPVLLAGELPGVAVVVGPDRAAAGRSALLRLDPPPDLFLLDDGFSHLALHRDLDLLVFPAADPWGGGRLPPSGRLREPLAAAARADAALLTGAAEALAELDENPRVQSALRSGEEESSSLEDIEPESSKPSLGRALAAGLAPHGYSGPGFACPVVTLPPRLATGEPLAPGSRVLLVSGIARPAGFRRRAEAAGLVVVGELVYPDHHAYPEASLAEIRRSFVETASAGGPEAVLATSKDRVKLQGRLEVPLAELPVEARPEPAFFAWLDERVDAARARHAAAAPDEAAPGVVVP